MVVTDGAWTPQSEDPKIAAQKYRDAGATVYAIGFGDLLLESKAGNNNNNHITNETTTTQQTRDINNNVASQHYARSDRARCPFFHPSGRFDSCYIRLAHDVI